MATNTNEEFTIPELFELTALKLPPIVEVQQ